MQNGITLIALVISIIVMLILAGVSISAIVGDDGILAKTQYASFINEMAAIEEAVQMWKVNQEEMQTAIPTNGICQLDELQKGERLRGEIGFYRAWNATKNKPEISVETEAVAFNSAFESETVIYPVGVQDLYYLNNEELGLSKNKKYLIDAATGIIYSNVGVSIKGVRVHSSYMAKAVNSGIIEMPNFIIAEVSGTGNSENLAGNTGTQYVDTDGNPVYKRPDGTFMDENGNVVEDTSTVKENENYNPNGFKIISSPASNNIYKLYNNGDLYAKGVKGTQINTPVDEMANLAPNKWTKLTVPAEIGSYKKIFQGAGGTMYVIDSQDYLWAWGSNSANKLGLTQAQQIEYTGREAVKLDVDGKKVKNVFDCSGTCFVVTDDNKLYGMGSNTNYLLGLGHNNPINKFTMIDFPKPDKIVSIIMTQESHCAIIKCSDNTFYAAGKNARSDIGNAITRTDNSYKKFCPMYNGYEYVDIGTTEVEYAVDETIGYVEAIDIDQDIEQIVDSDSNAFTILKKDGTMWRVNGNGWSASEVTSRSLSPFPETFGTNVDSIYSIGYGYLLKRNNGTEDEIWAANGVSAVFGQNTTSKKAVNVILPEELLSSGIKEIYTISSTVYYLSNDNLLYASSDSGNYVGLDKSPEGVVRINTPVKFKTLYPDGLCRKIDKDMTIFTNGVALFLGEDNELYTIGNSTIMYRNDSLEKTWVKIASDVKKVALAESNTICYIENGTNDLYVAGDNASFLDQHTDEIAKIPNFTKVDDELINKKVLDIQSGKGILYILTTEGNLYGTGKYSGDGSTGWPQDNYPGWEELEHHYDLVLILENVTALAIRDSFRMAVSDGELYAWGSNLYGSTQVSGRVPKKISITDFEDEDKIEKMMVSNYISAFLTEDGNLYARGGGSDSIANYNPGLALRFSKFELLNNTYIKLQADETIIDFDMNGSAFLVLTDKGNVYGIGNNAYLGNGSSESYRIEEFKKLNINDVSQISAGSSFLIVIKNDGTVWGTGSNTYGILGRWKGIDRNSPNSRYKTAFDWVECPELEI